MSTDSVIRARGLPWSASADEVLEFFGDCNVVGGVSGVHFTKNQDGRPSGQCYVEMESDADVEAALKKDKDKMGKRYIEVFQSNQEEMESDLSREKGGSGFNDDAVVKLRGLPFSATKNDVQDFFSGLEIERNGVMLVNDFSGRPKGDAFVQFCTPYGAKKALERNKQTMGHRYIEVFTSSMDEARRTQTQMAFGPPGRDGGGPMRGGNMGGSRRGPYNRMGSYGGSGGGRGMRGSYGGGPGGMMGGPMGPMGVMGAAMGAMGGGPMGGGGGMRGRGNSKCVVRMRGLPFRVSEQDIAEWFSSVADPVDIFINYNRDGRPSGEAEIMFATEGDAKRALQKDRQNMQHRYIELFLD